MTAITSPIKIFLLLQLWFTLLSFTHQPPLFQKKPKKHLEMFVYLLTDTLCYHCLEMLNGGVKVPVLKHFRWNYLGLFGVKQHSCVHFGFWERSRISSSCLSGPTVCFWLPQSSDVTLQGGAGARCPAVTSWPRCIYRWLYQLIGGLQHVESTQASKPRRKDSAAPVGFSV